MQCFFLTSVQLNLLVVLYCLGLWVGANVNATDEDGVDLLSLALHSQADLSLLQLLLDYGIAYYNKYVFGPTCYCLHCLRCKEVVLYSEVCICECEFVCECGNCNSACGQCMTFHVMELFLSFFFLFYFI